jgi:hypothetical protein
LAKRNRILEPVTAAFVVDKAGSFRAHSSAEASGRPKDQQAQDVRASLKRQERFRMEPVSHNQRIGP